MNLKNWNWKSTFWAIAIIITVLLPVMSLDSGNSGDEDTWQWPHANRVFDFYASFGQDTTYRTVPLMNPYGMWFEVLGVAIVRAFNVDDYHAVRKVMNALMGVLAILFAGLFAKNIGGWRAGTFVMILLFLSPRFLGHSFNNPKDIPFAAMFMVAMYFIHKFISEYPKFSIKTCIKLAIALGLTVSIRAPGILLYAYFAMFVGCFYLYTNKPKDYFSSANLKIIKRILIYFVCIVVGAHAITTLTWPFIMPAPIGNTIKAFQELSQYHVSIRQNFGGVMIWSSLLPWYYIPKFILITTPLIVIFGMLIYPFVGGWKKENRFSTFLIYFAFIFPIFWIIYTNANVYGGWRHMLFVYPFIAISAGLAFNALIDFGKRNYQKILLTILPFAFLIPTTVFIIKNHPYQYVYFNRIVGGVPGAFGFFELDYYYHSTREGSEWVIANATKTGLEAGDRIRVVSWHPSSVQYFFRHHTDRFEVGFSRWAERGNNDWDYAIFTITGMSPDMLRSDMFPPTNTVHQIKVSGVPIAIILKRTDKSDYFGNQLRNEGQLDSALVLLKHSLALVPSSESTLLNIAEIYLRKNQNDSSIVYLDKLLAFDPRNEIANYFRAHALMRQDRLDEAQQNLLIIINHNPKNDAAPWLSAQLHAQQGNLFLMDRMLERMLIANAGRQQEALDLMRRAYQHANMSENDANIAFTRIWINVLEALGFTAEARQMRNQR